MPLKFAGKAVMRVGQRLILQTKPKTKTEKEKQVKIQSISQEDQGRWGRLLQLVQVFFDEQLAVSGKDDFVLSGNPKTELKLDAKEKALMTALFKVIVFHFNTGADVSSVAEFQLPTSTNKQFAQAIRDRVAEEKRQLADAQPDPPPAVLLAPTPTRKLIEEHYEKPGTIKTNVNGVQGMESYAPPPCILSPVEKEA